MERKRWTSLFIKYGEQEAIEFFNTYQSQVDFDIISEPAEGLTMIKVREHAENSLFYIGEMLVTETKIRQGQTVGLGVVKGSNAKLSEALSFIDLCFKLEVLLEALEDILAKLELKESVFIKSRTNEILKTKVDFDMMAE
ncbi:phosphonate C-P lyase system protein PhnG [Salinicoccus cyprini]|uniref:Phosphonate C-P lyase system protein PhnG n=1 Tax=Salinicoccus cyprini TaxID=2493691 RepID=A0A558AXH6_9STAP|nr:phosphonate C-P lyase system protein PhnG [Salinicoccus cyprini]TVT28964.1 phosphonate C-P lyase system protein PhnG [Salinicoccus cyprini]